MLADPNNNYGVILWTPDEDKDWYDMRFRSSEHTNKPKLEVVWSNQPKTVSCDEASLTPPARTMSRGVGP
ncbi:hypothetical protein HUU40_32650 [candidate division KSB1 bacterium]|nr:hypothetical protein [candidate division KSB1 bacterium]